jgi:hypothetical protein
VGAGGAGSAVADFEGRKRMYTRMEKRLKRRMLIGVAIVAL